MRCVFARCVEMGKGKWPTTILTSFAFGEKNRHVCLASISLHPECVYGPRRRGHERQNGSLGHKNKNALKRKTAFLTNYIYFIYRTWMALMKSLGGARDWNKYLYWFFDESREVFPFFLALSLSLSLFFFSGRLSTGDMLCVGSGGFRLLIALVRFNYYLDAGEGTGGAAAAAAVE